MRARARSLATESSRKESLPGEHGAMMTVPGYCRKMIDEPYVAIRTTAMLALQSRVDSISDIQSGLSIQLDHTSVKASVNAAVNAVMFGSVWHARCPSCMSTVALLLDWSSVRQRIKNCTAIRRGPKQAFLTV